MVCHYLAKFGDNRYCSSRDMFLVCQVISHDYNHVIKGSGDYNNTSLSW